MVVRAHTEVRSVLPACPSTGHKLQEAQAAYRDRVSCLARDSKAGQMIDSAVRYCVDHVAETRPARSECIAADMWDAVQNVKGTVGELADVGQANVYAPTHRRALVELKCARRSRHKSYDLATTGNSRLLTTHRHDPA